MSNIFLKVTMFLWIIGLVLFILAQIFYKKKCSNFLKEAASLFFGLGLISFMIFPLFLKSVLWALALIIFIVGVIILAHSKS